MNPEVLQSSAPHIEFFTGMCDALGIENLPDGGRQYRDEFVQSLNERFTSDRYDKVAYNKLRDDLEQLIQKDSDLHNILHGYLEGNKPSNRKQRANRDLLNTSIHNLTLQFGELQLILLFDSIKNPNTSCDTIITELSNAVTEKLKIVNIILANKLGTPVPVAAAGVAPGPRNKYYNYGKNIVGGGINDMQFKQKYLKYKNKYMNLKNSKNIF
jgi:hypothetical protein